jgi:3-oxoacyl-[acyl-carrier protein] reductase
METAEAACSAIREKGGNAMPFPVDVRDPAAVNDTINKIIDKAGRIDILVNNAGVTRDGLLMRMKDEDWSLVLDTNLQGAFYFTRAVVKPMMKNRSGRIVNIASVIGLMGNAGQSNYAASKAGLIGFTKSVAREVATRGICVNAVAPGYIETDMTKKLDEEVKHKIRARIPMGTLGSPQDVADAVFFLCGEHSRYITGQVLTVDGGMVM